MLDQVLEPFPEAFRKIFELEYLKGLRSCLFNGFRLGGKNKSKKNPPGTGFQKSSLRSSLRPLLFQQAPVEPLIPPFLKASSYPLENSSHPNDYSQFNALRSYIKHM